MAKKKRTGGRKKVGKVMHEYKKGSLKSSSGRKVKKRKQAVAIALNEARSSGAKIPRKRGSRSKTKRKSAGRKSRSRR